MQLKTLVLAILVPLLAVGGIGVLLLKQHKDTLALKIQKDKEERERRSLRDKEKKARNKRLEEERRRKIPLELVSKAGKSEAYGKWLQAARLYKDALTYGDNDETKRRLRAVTIAMDAEKLEKAKKWDDAIKAYEQARVDIVAKKRIDGKIVYLTALRDHHAAVAKGDQLLKAGKKADAVKSYEEAAELAATHHIPTDLPRRLRTLRKSVAEHKDTTTGIVELARMWNVKKELLALLALHTHCLSRDEYAAKHEDLKIRKTAIEKELATALTQERRFRVSDKDKVIEITLKDGTTLRGELVEESKAAYRVLVIDDDGKITKRLIVRSTATAAKVIPPEDLNEEAARGLLRRAFLAYSRKEYLRALRCAGQLQHEFPDSKVLADKEAQKHIGAQISLKLLDELGGTLEGMVAKALHVCQGMCFECDGTGWKRCPKCNGLGVRRLECDACLGKGNRPCDACRGTGRYGKNKCDVCKGRKMVPCDFCKGRGYLERRCDDCMKRECSTCQGKGQKPIGMCRACGGSGRVNAGADALPCGKCAGTGLMFSSKPCPACRGKRYVGMVRCAACGGTGRRRK